MSKFKKGIILSEDTKLKMSIAQKGKTLNKNTKLKISIAKKGKTLNKDTKLKISITKGTTIFVYSFDNILINTFTSTKKVAFGGLPKF
jgi:hypothetical protein